MYIGDECLVKRKNGTPQYIKLSTNDFTYEQQKKVLIPKLYNFDPRLRIVKKNGFSEDQYSIFIPRYKIKEFLYYIGECPFSEYSYKWDYREYKNFYIKTNENFEKDIMHYFNLGINANEIARHYEVDRSTIVRYLKLNNVDPNINTKSRIKIKDLIEGIDV